MNLESYLTLESYHENSFSLEINSANNLYFSASKHYDESDNEDAAKDIEKAVKIFEKIKPSSRDLSLSYNLEGCIF
jgi:hypothetical protein